MKNVVNKKNVWVTWPFRALYGKKNDYDEISNADKPNTKRSDCSGYSFIFRSLGINSAYY